MGTIASQITSLTTVCSTVYSDADQRKHQCSASLLVRGMHRWPVNSLPKWPVTRKMFPFDDVIMPLQFTTYLRLHGLGREDCIGSLSCTLRHKLSNVIPPRHVPFGDARRMPAVSWRLFHIVRTRISLLNKKNEMRSVSIFAMATVLYC